MSLVHAAPQGVSLLPLLTSATKQLVAQVGLSLSTHHVAEEPPLAGWTSADGMVTCHPCGEGLYVDTDFDHDPEDLATLLGLLETAGYVPSSEDPFDDEMYDDGMRVYFDLASELVPA